ncbi:MAG: hypothetical protein HC828_07085 [Blastochloris sp.]|nr:hypothetical protein [Blastochloris sp.]
MQAPGVTAALQLGNYDRATGNVTWSSPINLHGSGESNYNWTRTNINLRDAFGGSPPGFVTFRFILSGGGSVGGQRVRWNIDDIQVFDNVPANRQLTVGNAWDLNSRSQMADFYFNSDAASLIELNPNVFNNDQNPVAYRWNLESGVARSGTAFHESPGGNFNVFTDGERQHTLQLRFPVNVTSSVAPATDLEGDNGSPVLTFWYAYDLPAGTSLQVQYAPASAPTNWQPLPGNRGVLLSATTPSGGPNEQTVRSLTVMQPVEIDLTTIPNWDTSAFFVRWVMTSAAGATPGNGVWIDDIKIERASASGYTSYPFVDSAEDSNFTNQNWRILPDVTGNWGTSSAQGGYGGSTNAYTDSAAGNYAATAGQARYLELRRPIDLRRDTALNTTEPTRPAASSPILSFYHKRLLADGAQLVVQIARPGTLPTWQTIWTFTAGGTASQQNEWERAEIDLNAAMQTALGTAYTATAGGTDTDDDILVRFGFLTSGTVVAADGVFIDEIRVQNATALVHTLSSGDYSDTIESSSLTGVPLNQRWHLGGRWGSISEVSTFTDFVYNGSSSLHDSPPVFELSNPAEEQYRDQSRAIAQLAPVIDMTGVTAADLPRLTFWTRFEVGTGDEIRVEISEANSDNVIGFDKEAGWSGWSRTTPSSVNLWSQGVGRTDTWTRQIIDLSEYAGRRIRVRFVIETPDTAQQGDGWFLDSVTITRGLLTAVPMPLVDDANTLTNWVAEGRWGVTDQYAFVDISSPPPAANLGAGGWSGWLFDCEGLRAPEDDVPTPLTCADPAQYSNILARVRTGTRLRAQVPRSR